MKLSYDPLQLATCHTKGCENRATTIIRRIVAGEHHLISYCEFHAIVANDFFGDNANRIELKGIRL